MSKDAFYFPHDFNAHNDSKIIKLSMEGWDLVGLYWSLIGMMHEQGGYLDSDPGPLAFALRTNNERITKVIHFPDLFIVDNGHFTNARVLSNLKLRKEKSKKARESIQSRWNKEVMKDTNVLRTKYEGNTIKERKGKEIKGNNKSLFDFESLWLKYPKKLGKYNAQRHFRAQVKTNQDYNNIQMALNNFLASDIARGEYQYIPMGSTWFNHRWEDFMNLESSTGKSQAYLEVERLMEDARRARLSQESSNG